MFKKLIVIQPILTSYRKNLFDEISNYFDEVVVYADLNPGNGFKSDVEGVFHKVHTPVFGDRKKIYYQRGIIFSLILNRPTAIFATADFRALHFWIILIISKILKVPFFAHGQGLYDKPSAGVVHKLLFKTITRLSSQYICYTDSVLKTLINIGIDSKELAVIHNTIVNKYPIEPKEKSTKRHRLCYIGRLRDGSGLLLLFEAMKLLRKRGKIIGIDIIGDGEQRSQLEKFAQDFTLDVSFFGAIYDDKIIADISKNATIGVYPGDAGLSIVHYMSLSLVPLVHNSLSQHMGPEASYIEHGVNGFTFSRNDSKSLALSLESLLSDDVLVQNLASAAFNTYLSLSSPSMAEKLFLIMKPYIKE